MKTVAEMRVRGRVIAYLALTATLLLLAVWLHGSSFRGQASGHTVLETVAALLAMFVGLVAIVHYYTGHSSRYLFVGSAFLGAALLDGYHAVVTSAWFPLLWPSPPQALIPWSWYSSRLLLAILFLALWRRDARQDQDDAMPRAREQWAVFLPVGLMTLASFAFFAFVNLPRAYFGQGLLGRPQELIAAALFLLALAGFLSEGRWRRTVLDHTLILFLILSVATQAFFMAFARNNHDAMFAAAHVAKIGSYSILLLGVLRSMHGVLWQAREDARALQIQARELEQHVAQRTAELRETAESFRLLFAANPHPMWVFDAETLAFLEVNDAAVAHYGYSREAFLQMRISDIRPEEDVPRLLQTVSQERSPLSKGSEWRHRLQDGRVIDVEIASHALTFEGRPARLVIAQDITERKAAREAAVARVEQFAIVADLSLKALSGAEVATLMNEAVRLVAQSLHVDYVKVLELLPHGDALLLRAGVGWEADYPVGLATVPAGHDSQAGYTLAQDEPVVVHDLRRETRFSGPALLVEHGVVSGISVIIPGSENPFGVFGVHTTRLRRFEAHDIAFVQAVANVLATAIERERADQMLKASEERFRAVVQNAMDMVTVLNADGAIVYDSPAVQRVLGYEPQERLGRSAGSFTHPEDVPLVREKLAQLATEPGAQASAQIRVRHRDGSWRTVEATGTNMAHNEALGGTVVNWHDITERVQHQREIERLNARLEERVRRRTEQLEAANKELEAFAYSVSHDLRAPLRAMDGFARILLGESTDELSEKAQRYLKRIRHNAQQMDQLIQDLLAFSRLNRQELRRQPVQPERLVQEALAHLEEEMAGRQVDIVVQPLPRVHADPALLRVVFANLLANALKYTRTREPARVVVGAEQPATEEVDPLQGAETVFFVRDNGVGFDMKYADKLFGVFQRLHRAEEYEGTGVGLATVQRIIRRHGGRVWVDAAVDQGATIYFTLEETEP